MFGHREVVTGTADGSTRLSYGEMRTRVLALTAVLRDLGVGPGDRVVTFAWNSHRHLELFFAVPAIGAVLQPINVRFRPDDVQRLVDEARPRALFVDASLAAAGPTLRGEGVEVVLPDVGPARNALDYEELLGGIGRVDGLPVVSEDAVATACTTSGTTGAPRQVEYTHRALVLGTLGLNQADGAGLRESDSVLPVVSLFHANAWGLPFAAAMAGARLVLCGSPTAATTARLIREEQVSKLASVPATLTRLLEEPGLDLSSVEEALVAGAAPSPALVAALERHGVAVVHAWGMTETGFFGLVSRPPAGCPTAEGYDDLRSFQGRPVALVEARVDGELGELQVRGSGVAGRYADADLRQERVTYDGWLRTGDVVATGPNSYLRIVDRIGDAVKSGGEWIHTLELESHLAAYPGIEEAAVVPVSDDVWGARPYAFVCAPSGAPVDCDDLARFLRARVPTWWIPDVIEVVEALPRTANGKVDKRALRDAARDAVASDGRTVIRQR